MTRATDLIAAERQRQIDEEGFDVEHDEGQSMVLALAGATYALRMENRLHIGASNLPMSWPWAGQHWKPTPDDRERELVKAGALIAAAIDALGDEQT